jgi:hypothetical protein
LHAQLQAVSGTAVVVARIRCCGRESEHVEPDAILALDALHILTGGQDTSRRSEKVPSLIVKDELYEIHRIRDGAVFGHRLPLKSLSLSPLFKTGKCAALNGRGRPAHQGGSFSAAGWARADYRIGTFGMAPPMGEEARADPADSSAAAASQHALQQPLHAQQQLGPGLARRRDAVGYTPPAPAMAKPQARWLDKRVSGGRASLGPDGGPRAYSGGPFQYWSGPGYAQLGPQSSHSSSFTEPGSGQAHFQPRRTSTPTAGGADAIGSGGPSNASWRGEDGTGASGKSRARRALLLLPPLLSLVPAADA